MNNFFAWFEKEAGTIYVSMIFFTFIISGYLTYLIGLDNPLVGVSDGIVVLIYALSTIIPTVIIAAIFCGIPFILAMKFPNLKGHITFVALTMYLVFVFL